MELFEKIKEKSAPWFYDMNWVKQPFSYGYPIDEEDAPRPDGLEKMLELSRILCKGFRHIRVDWYNMPDGRVLFGEMTFTTWSGLNKFCPEKYDLEFGKLFDIETIGQYQNEWRRLK